jgi:hypothetical protein
MLLGEVFFLRFAVPRALDPALILTAAFRAWTVMVIIVTTVWLFQDWKLKLQTRINLLFTGMNALIGLTYLLYTTYALYKKLRF